MVKSPAQQRKQWAALIAALIALALIIGATLIYQRIAAGGAAEVGASSSGSFGAGSPGSGAQNKESSTAVKNSTGKPTSSAAKPSNPSNLPTIKASQLPAEGRKTLALINQGGPYPYDRDGVNFGNFEGVLPKQRSGYYQEYTVKTPGESDRGARRIIVGGHGEKYYTDDHYASFRFILEGQ